MAENSPVTDPREALIHYSREALTRGLSNATSGNISVCSGDGMLITPSGVSPLLMKPEQMVQTGFDGSISGDWKPSSEWALHAAIYQRRPEVGAIVHGHPLHCTALSALRCPLPAFHYLIGKFGGAEVPCCSYETFGTPALAEAVVETVADRYCGCLMANHGMIAFAADLAHAFALTELMEILAQQYLLAKSSGLPVHLLSDEQVADVARQAGALNYGEPRRA